jgi:hypothetical protein
VERWDLPKTAQQSHTARHQRGDPYRDSTDPAFPEQADQDYIDPLSSNVEGVGHCRESIPVIVRSDL